MYHILWFTIVQRDQQSGNLKVSVTDRPPYKLTRVGARDLKTRPSALGMSDPGVEPLEILEILELETPPYHPHLDFLTTCLFGHPEENC